MIGGNIALSDSGVPEMLVLPVSGAFDTESHHCQYQSSRAYLRHAQKRRESPTTCRGKRIAVEPIRLGLGSSPTRMVLRSWKLDPEKDVDACCNPGNTPTRMTALIAGHVDGALVSPESLHKVLASGCCRSLADLSELPLRLCPLRRRPCRASLMRNQRDVARPHRHGLRRGNLRVQNKTQAGVLTCSRRKASRIRPIAQRNLCAAEFQHARISDSRSERNTKCPRFARPPERAQRQTGRA